jgi:hypothetical protein
MMTRLMISILIVLIAGVIGIAALLQPENSGDSYWVSVAWGIFLLVLNWYSSAAIFSGDKSDQEGTPGSAMGSLPGISVGIFIYSLTSITILLLNRASLLGNTWHLVLQIIFAMIIVSITLLALVAAKAQRSGSESSVTQRELLSSLKSLYKSADESNERMEINELINYVSYQMPHTSKLDGIELKNIFKAFSDTSLDNSSRLIEAKKLLRM